MKLVGNGWRMLVLAAFVAGCKDGGGGTSASVATSVTAESPTSQTALAGTAVTTAPSVKVLDQRGNPMAGVTVSFSANGGGSVLSPTAVTGTTGVASAGTWTLGPNAGAQTVTATVASLTPVQFSATATARVATTIVAVSPTTQTGTVGAAVAQPPIVRVSDQTGQQMAGVPVVFAVTAGGGQIASQTVVTVATSASGSATPGSWTLGAAAGQNTVTATVAGLPPVVFNATATAAGPDPCTTGVAYTLGATVSGSLATTDCRLSTGEYIDFYTTSLPTAQAVQYSMSSTAVDAWLELYDGTGNLVAFNDDATDNNTNSAVRVYAPAGNYIVAATSYDPSETGAYQLSSSAIMGNTTCQMFWVVPNVVINGSLANPDCTFSGLLYDDYLVVVRQGQTITMRMESTALNAKLELYNIEGNLVTTDDNGAGGTNAQITYTYTGTGATVFFISATTAVAGGNGAYTLTVNRSGGAAESRSGAASPADVDRSGARPLGPRAKRPLRR